MVSAALMNCFSLIEMACTRTKRVYQGHQETMMAILALVNEGPSRAAIAMARSIGGKLKKISVIRMISSSSQPPIVPAIAPNKLPMTTAKKTVTKAASSEILVP